MYPKINVLLKNVCMEIRWLFGRWSRMRRDFEDPANNVLQSNNFNPVFLFNEAGENSLQVNIGKKL